MRRIDIYALLCICALTSSARSLNVTTGNVTYSFSEATMGEAALSQGNELTISGKVFATDNLTSMKVVADNVDENTVLVNYGATETSVTVAGNVARYVEVTVSGGHVTVTQSSEVADNTPGEITYILKGESSDGSFSLSGSYKSTIELQGVTLHNPSGAALDIQNGKRIALSSKNGTVNKLSDGDGGSNKAALYCKGHLELKGKGSLTVTGNNAHAISAKEYVTIKNCDVTIDKSVKDGINCAQYFAMESGSLTMSGVGDDGIQVDYKDDVEREAEDTGSFSITGGTVTISVTADAAKAIKTEGNIGINGGTLNLSVSGNGVWDSTKLKTKASSCLSSDADIAINAGDLELKASGGGGKGLSCDGTLTIAGGNVTVVTSGGVVAYVNNKLYTDYTGNTDNINSDYKSSPKGMKADTAVFIEGGVIDVTTTGRGAEGIESKGELTINGGTIVVHSYDDAINSSSHMYINGGDILVVATNNDGLDSNGNLYMNGGYVRAFGASSPECGIDANEEEGYTVIFTGGTLLAVGGGNSTPTKTASTQPYVSTNTSVTAGSTITLKSGSSELASFEIPAEYTGGSGNNGGHGGPGGGFGGNSGKSVLITCPGLTSGSSYSMTSGSTTVNVSARLTGSGSGRPW